jgi:hypothetical protein
MQPLKAHVHNGRLVLDEPTDLPEGKVVFLQPVDGDDMDDEERAALIDVGIEAVKARVAMAVHADLMVVNGATKKALERLDRREWAAAHLTVLAGAASRRQIDEFLSRRTAVLVSPTSLREIGARGFSCATNPRGYRRTRCSLSNRRCRPLRPTRARASRAFWTTSTRPTTPCAGSI